MSSPSTQANMVAERSSDSSDHDQPSSSAGRRINAPQVSASRSAGFRNPATSGSYYGPQGRNASENSLRNESRSTTEANYSGFSEIEVVGYPQVQQTPNFWVPVPGFGCG